MTVKMPRIGKDDFVLTVYSQSEVGCTYTLLNLTGYGDDRMEAYKAMLSVVRAHLAREAEIAP